MNRKILVTGSDGFLGGHIVQVLLERGFDVRAFVLPGNESKMAHLPGVDVFAGNILNPADCDKAVEGVHGVIHAAASTSTWPERSEIVYKVNYDGTVNILKSAQDAKLGKFVHIGSANCFKPGSLEQPGDELGKYVGDTFRLDYIDSKYEALQAVMKSASNEGFPAVAVCPTFMIGPNDPYMGTSRLILAVIKGKLPFTTRGGKCFVFVKDVAVAAVNALEKGKPGEAYIAGNINLTFEQFTGKVATIGGVNPPRMVIPTSLLLFFAHTMGWMGKTFGFKPMLSQGTARIAVDDQYFTAAKAVREIEMPQTSIDEAIFQACSWLKEKGMV